MTTIDSLPSEILDSIVDLFCHDSNKDDVFFSGLRTLLFGSSMTYGPNRCVNRSTLAAICLTSRRLNAAATRHLYHHLYTPRWWLLMRTLVTRPDLARHARSLRVTYATKPLRNEIRGALRKHLLARRHRQCLNRLLSPHGTRGSERLGGIRRRYTPIRRNVDDIYDHYDLFMSAALDGLISLVPQIESLGFDPQYCRHLFSFKAPLSALRHLSVTMTDWLRFFRVTPVEKAVKENLSSLAMFGLAEAGDLILNLAPRMRQVCLDVSLKTDWHGYWEEDTAKELGVKLAERGIRFEFIDAKRPNEET
ncbi:hypothetical protein VTJ49DRAFT_3863 [Mycothermus thermophilus]|uniref:F-box domain-containing protein n=1 Tax=Humicola insolens TaxID=85995 RepID=A0ABR3VR21_HUMIN